MEANTRGRALGYAGCGVLALAIALGVAMYRGADVSLPLGLNCRYLSDGLFFSGVMFTGVGALTLVAGTGFFDIFGYAVRSLLVLFSALRKPEEHTRFYEYKLEKQAKRKKPLWAIFLTGVGCILLSALCLMLYYKV